MPAWSKLQRALYLIVADEAALQIHCARYRMKSQRGSTDLPRYWITVGGEIVFDYPRQFIHAEENENYPYETQISDISALIREYIDTPLSDLPEKRFDRDAWGLTDILKAADRRLGKERLRRYFLPENAVAEKILRLRFEN